jgi:hypothetical protein
MAEDDYAVVVGINNYPKLKKPLDGPENDARDFVAWLRKKDGGNVPKENISILLGSELTRNGARPNVGEIDDRFDLLHGGFNDEATGRTGRRLYIFLAGHGFDPTGDDTALLCATASRRRLGDHISGRLYSLWFKKSGLFEEIVLFMDCCRDDYDKAPPRSPPWLPENRPSRDFKMATAFATKWAYKSRERTDPDDPEQRVRGLFSKALLEALNAGRLTGDQLKGFTINRLHELVKDDEYQEPEITIDDGMVFGEDAGPAQGSVEICASAARKGHTFALNDPEGQLIETRLMSDAKWQHTLPFGRYVLVDLDDASATHYIDVLKGKIHDEF